MKIINLTPHALRVETPQGWREVPPSGQVARVACRWENVGEVDGIPVHQAQYGEVEGLPEPREDTVYIVSSLVLERVRGRQDVYAPGELVRDEAGRPIGCRGLKTAGGAE